MALIFMFCHQDELKDWIVELCSGKDLGALCLGSAKTWEVVPPEALTLSDVGYQFFLFPKRSSIPGRLSMNDVRPRDWGWITVRPGGLRRVDSKSVLFPTEIHGEKCDLETGDPEKWVQWLKRRIKPDVHHGVRGRNIATDGHSDYQNIWYTQKARELFESGVVWKQFPNDNSEFEPLAKCNITGT
jgi:hypothetical protein